MVDMLPDDARSQEIFDFFVNETEQIHDGVRWCTRAENGGKLFLGHHVA